MWNGASFDNVHLGCSNLFHGHVSTVDSASQWKVKKWTHLYLLVMVEFGRRHQTQSHCKPFSVSSSNSDLITRGSSAPGHCYEIKTKCKMSGFLLSLWCCSKSIFVDLSRIRVGNSFLMSGLNMLWGPFNANFWGAVEAILPRQQHVHISVFSIPKVSKNTICHEPA